jgi:hypothetical protein
MPSFFSFLKKSKNKVKNNKNSNKETNPESNVENNRYNYKKALDELEIQVNNDNNVNKNVLILLF